jgi:hypothetical protein
VVGVAVFVTAAVPPGPSRLALAAVAMGLGIATMHYLGMSALRGVFCVGHDPLLAGAAIVVGIAVSAGALLPFARPQTKLPLAPSALLFGVAVAGLHYTAMAGVELDFASLCAAAADELVLGEQELALVVSLLGFVVAGGFLLYLLPDAPAAALPAAPGPAPRLDVSPRTANPSAAPGPSPSEARAPLRVPVRGFDGIRLLAPEDISWLRAEAHYSRVFDGRREGLCDWSISEAEAKLAPLGFYRCHRCHLVRIDRVRALRRAGKGAILSLAGEPAHEVPVSRGRLAELERRLGLRASG